jgi:hypothetical protein
VLHRLQQAYSKYAALTTHASVVARFQRRALNFQTTLCCKAGITDPSSVRANGGRPGSTGSRWVGWLVVLLVWRWS